MKISESKLLSLLTSALLCLTLMLGPAGAVTEAAGSIINLKPGESAMLEIEGIDYAEWYSTDTDVCSCYDGLIIAKGEGTAEVCAAFDGIVLKCTVKVGSGSGSGSTYNRSGKSGSDSTAAGGKTVNVRKGKSTVITVKSSSHNLKFKYSGTKAISLSVSYDKSKGEYRLTVKGKANGTAKITAYEKGNSRNKAEINVTVSDKASTENAVFTLSSASGSSKPSKADNAGSSKSGDYTNEVIRLVNEERESRGLPGLTKDDTLCKNANTRVNELTEKFSHTRPNGKSCFTAITVPYGYVGENIAAGQRDPDEVMDSWMNSEGHRKNILSKNYTKIGVAYDPSGNYWVQIFISD